MLVTLDTNVIYQALRSSSGASHYILSLMREKKFRVALTVPVFSEYRAVLTRPKSLTEFGMRKDEVEDVLRLIALDGQVFDTHFLFRPNLKDENDNMVIELAIASQSDFLVTSNTKDFMGGELTFDNFNLVTPAEFVREWRKKNE